MRRLHALVALLLVLACGTRSPMHAQELVAQVERASTPVPKLLACGLAPVSPNCEIPLRAGQDSVQFSVEINPSVQHPSKDSVPVTISTSRCCIRTQTVIPDRNGFVNLTWTASQKPDSSFYVRFVMRDPKNQLLRDSIRIVKAPTPTPLTPYTTPYHQTAPRYVWIRGDHVPVEIPIRIDALGHPDSTRVDRARCERVRAIFVPVQGGDASPDSARAIWSPKKIWISETKEWGWDSERADCVVQTRWRLADDAGEQVLDVTIGGDSGVARSRMQLTAFARQTPRLSGGYGYFTGLRQDRDRTCAELAGNPRCAGRADTSKVTVQEREGSGSAFFGVEFPIFIRYAVADQSPIGKYLSEHLRLVFGTTFERPADNIFVGITVLPLFWGASEAAPFQISAGLGRHGWETRYVGIALDATTIVAPVLAAIGIGK